MLYVPRNFSHRPFCGCQHANVVKSLVANEKAGRVGGLFDSDPLSDDMPPPLGVLQVKRLRVLAAAARQPLLPPSALRLFDQYFALRLRSTIKQLCFCPQLISDAMMQNARMANWLQNVWDKESHQCALRHRAVMRQFIVQGIIQNGKTSR